MIKTTFFLQCALEDAVNAEDAVTVEDAANAENAVNVEECVLETTHLSVFAVKKELWTSLNFRCLVIKFSFCTLEDAVNVEENAVIIHSSALEECMCIGDNSFKCFLQSKKNFG